MEKIISYPKSPSPRGAAPGKFRELNFPAILSIACALAYANSFRGTYIFDDYPAIYDNPTIRSLWPLWSALWAPRDTPNAGRPLVNYSFALNYAMSGLDLWSYHLSNVLIHLTGGLALFGIVRRTSSLIRCPDMARRRANSLAFVIALLWLVHPIQTGAVTYLVIRNESLMGMFYLLTLYAFVRSASDPRPQLWMWLSVVFCYCGSASKENMATAPLVIAVFDWMFVAKDVREVVKRRWPYHAGLLSSWLLIAGIIMAKPRTLTTGFEMEDLNSITYARTEAGVLLHYLRLSVWPHPLVLDYFDWPLATSWGPAIFPCAVIVALLAMTVRLVARRRPVGFVGAWFFLILAPSSSLMPIREIAWEYRMYLPLAGVITLAIFSAARLLEFLPPARRKIVGASALILCATIFTGLTIRRNALYASDIALYQDTVEHRPGNYRAWNNLGVAMLRAERLDEAKTAFENAVKSEPRYADPEYFLARIELVRSRFPEAEAHARRASELIPRYGEAHGALAAALHAQKRIAEAEPEYRVAIELLPGVAGYHDGLGNVLADLGRTEEAEAAYRKAIELLPQYAEAHNDLGVILAERGRKDEAIAEFGEALRINPSYAAAYGNLIHALEESGRMEEAKRAREGAAAAGIAIQ